MSQWLEGYYSAMDRLDAYLDKLDDDSTGYSDNDIVALASTNPRGMWGRRETLNVVSREIQAEYVIWRESVIEDAEIVQTGVQGQGDTPARKLLDARCDAYHVKMELDANMEMMRFDNRFRRFHDMDIFENKCATVERAFKLGE